MSLQNVLLRQYLTHRIKRRLKDDLSFEVMRRELDEAIATYMPPPPDGIEIEAIEGSVAGERVRARGGAADLTVLYFHGGGFVMGSPASHRGVASALAREVGCECSCPATDSHPSTPTLPIAGNARCDPAGTPEDLRRCVDAFAPRRGRASAALSPLMPIRRVCRRVSSR